MILYCFVCVGQEQGLGKEDPQDKLKSIGERDREAAP